MGAAFATVLYEPVFAVMARELKDDYRRGIIAITLVAGLASTVFIPLTHVLVEISSWREALMVLALIQIPFGVALHWIVLGRSASGALPSPPADPAPPGRMRAAMRSPVFWLLSVSYAAHSFMFTAVTFHILPLLAERGVSMAAAVAAYTLVGPAQVVGRIVVFALERRIDVRVAGIVATTLPVLGIGALLLVTPGSPLLYVFAVLYGGGMGIKTIVQATAAPEFLGREGYGALQGALAGFVYVVQAVTPFLAAVIWSLGGGYGPVLWVLLGATVISAAAFVLAAIVSRPRP
jgi:cyanate permease